MFYFDNDPKKKYLNPTILVHHNFNAQEMSYGGDLGYVLKILKYLKLKLSKVTLIQNYQNYYMHNSNHRIHTSRMIYREIWVGINDLDSSPYHVYLITFVAYDFAFIPLSSRLC